MYGQILQVNMTDPVRRAEVVALLGECGISLDRSVESTYGLYDSGELIATASVFGASIRSVAVTPKAQGSNAIARIVDFVIQTIYKSGFENVYVFTSSFNAKTFKQLGFFEVVRGTGNIVLLERNPRGIANYVEELSDFKVCVEDVGAIVMNANPFTLGHLYLVEQAAKKCDYLFVWVVKEDVSAVPYEARLKLVQAGVSHLNNVYVIEGSDYVISSATFPSYFSEDTKEATSRFAEIDLRLFATYISKTLGIKKRFVGTEPYCAVTNAYNQTMKKILGDYGIEVIEVDRLSEDAVAISASRVRELVMNKDMTQLKRLVPDTTYDYLTSEDGKKVLSARLKRGKRH
ncbi:MULTISPECIES: [citrate (pro-3S)-lyase] ligase [unclassified Fusibacter]|uniref:[citrate (pro-3S)-lyase] ligase n=1 Tax=unclassified Fusibacter TaxID=2624464 RepID=UPI001011A3A5|nr:MULTISPECIES: [citrate (pro-3S)-lyase] ligase [unclassified Fusibacter]MCK8058594.1 [citrate (pro-3S)-lyase] ligase [Fusibacter sp. A2]NPE22636.1 [citrate (pro-3S)-lyase] ligase [Fusibacter sp. A1]RXV60200.1 [citrate (pro-3S)-lyase] ligase [Fusibacter sp. A1]